MLRGVGHKLPQTAILYSKLLHFVASLPLVPWGSDIGKCPSEPKMPQGLTGAEKLDNSHFFIANNGDYPAFFSLVPWVPNLETLYSSVNLSENSRRYHQTRKGQCISISGRAGHQTSSFSRRPSFIPCPETKHMSGFGTETTVSQGAQRNEGAAGPPIQEDFNAWAALDEEWKARVGARDAADPRMRLRESIRRMKQARIGL